MFLNRREMELRKVRFEETFQPGEIEFLDPKLWQAGPLTTTGAAELLPNTNGEIRIRGTLKVVMECECDRCLETARFPLKLDFDLFYEPLEEGPEDLEVSLEAEDSTIDFYEGEGLLLEDVLREQVLLALPMQRICRQDCKGICPICGQNRNRGDCGCKPVIVDDRWAALREL